MSSPIRLDGLDPFVGLKLFDAHLSELPLAHNLECVDVRLKPGAYAVLFHTSAWERLESFLVLPDDHGERTITPQSQTRSLVSSAAPMTCAMARR